MSMDSRFLTCAGESNARGYITSDLYLMMLMPREGCNGWAFNK